MPIQSGAQLSDAGQRGAREVGPVVLLAQVRGEQMLQPRIVQASPAAPPRRRCRDAPAGRRCAASADTDNRRWPACRHRDCIRAPARRNPDRLASTCSGRRAEIGQHAEPPAAVGADELHRLARIVRHRETVAPRWRRSRNGRGCRSRRRAAARQSARRRWPACRRSATPACRSARRTPPRRRCDRCARG